MAEWVSAVSALLLVLATVTYVYYTIKLAKETAKLREVETSPFITVYFQPFKHSHYIEIVVENIGKSPAYELKIEYDEAIKKSFNDKGLDIPLINLNYFSVNQTARYFVGKYREDLEELPIIISYKSKDNNHYKEIINFNFNFNFGKLDISKPYEIEKLDQNFDKIVEAINSLKK